ncbi:23053_t:CDS:2 [Rhizophagus irregularis]|nr:23053_t:CDS:2 [Rhizophagus irregularis]
MDRDLNIDERKEKYRSREEIIDVLTSEELFYKLLNLRLDLAALPSSSSDTKRLLDVPDSSELEPMPTTQIATDVVDS